MKVSAANADRRDVERMYNRRTIRQLQQLAPFVSIGRVRSSVSRKAADLQCPAGQSAGHCLAVVHSTYRSS